MFPFGVTVTRLRRRMVPDPYSGEDTLGSWADADEALLVGVALAPLTPEEQATVDAHVARNSMTLLAGHGADILPTDRIRDTEGVVWDVDGYRADWRSPFTGHEFGSATRLHRTEEL